MAGKFTVQAVIVEAVEDKPEVIIKLTFETSKAAISVREQLKADGYTAYAQLIKELD